MENQTHNQTILANTNKDINVIQASTKSTEITSKKLSKRKHKVLKGW